MQSCIVSSNLYSFRWTRKRLAESCIAFKSCRQMRSEAAERSLINKAAESRPGGVLRDQYLVAYGHGWKSAIHPTYRNRNTQHHVSTTAKLHSMSFALVVTLVVLFPVSCGIYRLRFSPLAHIPGPKIAGNQHSSHAVSHDHLTSI